MGTKPKILILCDYYLPGYQSGGGMRTIVNMVARLRHEFDFWIITRDHDGPLDQNQYTSVRINEWNKLQNCYVYYLSKDKVKISNVLQLIKMVKPNSIYLNSYFSTLAIYVLILRRLRLIKNIQIILAPCGELSIGALKIKARKKKLFMAFARLARLHQGIIWKASSDLEKVEIEKRKSEGGEIFVAADLTPPRIFDEYNQSLKPKKESGTARLVFLSRFDAKKNFKFLLRLLPQIEGNLSIDILGPIEDPDYWAQCRAMMKNLPANIKVESQGLVPYEKVPETLFDYHFFILPTLGENFGHVFVEALAAGCPLIISDRTPWLDLEEKMIGWDIPLENSQRWIDTLNYCIGMGGIEYHKWSSATKSFINHWLNNKKLEEDTLTVLNASLRKTLN